MTVRPRLRSGTVSPPRARRHCDPGLLQVQSVHRFADWLLAREVLHLCGSLSRAYPWASSFSGTAFERHDEEVNTTLSDGHGSHTTGRPSDDTRRQIHWEPSRFSQERFVLRRTHGNIHIMHVGTAGEHCDC